MAPPKNALKRSHADRNRNQIKYKDRSRDRRKPWPRAQHRAQPGPQGRRPDDHLPTDFGGGVVRDNPEINKLVASNTALGRVGVPDDIGPMIAALLSDDNRWITAQRIEVSGGMFL
jgi:NAD(P)-dependent dehydrogenase (short-subunit alcohol dehydrogenase family)